LISTGSSDVGPSICIHTSAPWGLKNIEMDKDKAAVEILKHLQTLLPRLPDPVEVKGHKWRYSQVSLRGKKKHIFLLCHLPEDVSRVMYRML
jgi:predicted NAD/FAD-dependent oxidoreductase